jgi:hypothetical protein
MLNAAAAAAQIDFRTKKIMHPMIRKTTMAQHTKRLMISVAVFTKDRRHTY